MMGPEEERLIVQVVWNAQRIVDSAHDTTDGMVEMTWSEFVHLRDAVHNYREWVLRDR